MAELRPASDLDPRAYEFANRLWVNYVFKEDRTRALLLIAAYSLAPFALGLVLAAAYDSAPTYLSNLAIYYGTFGIFLTTASLWHGSKAQYECYSRFLSCFSFDKGERSDILRRTLARYSSNGKNAQTSVVVFTLAMIVTVVAFKFPATRDLAVDVLDLRVFKLKDFDEAGWYSQSAQPWAFWCTTVFALFIALPLGTATRVILRMPLMLYSCARSPVALLPRLIKSRFDALAHFYTRISVLWAVGVMLFVALFRDDRSWFTVMLVLFLFVAGVLAFLVPQLLYARVVEHSQARWLDHVERELLPDTLQRQDTAPTRLTVSAYSIPAFYLDHDRWVYPIHETYLVIGVQLASVIGLSKLDFFSFITKGS